jgi:uncharacterized membrane protein YebE (DUF533 family)
MRDLIDSYLRRNDISPEMSPWISPEITRPLTIDVFVEPHGNKDMF